MTDEVPMFVFIILPREILTGMSGQGWARLSFIPGKSLSAVGRAVPSYKGSNLPVGRHSRQLPGAHHTPP